MDICRICGKKCSGDLCEPCNRKIAEDMAKQLRKEQEEMRKQKPGSK